MQFFVVARTKADVEPRHDFFLSTPHHDLKKAHNLRKWAQLHWYLGGPFGNGKSATHHIFISFISFQPPLLLIKKTPLFDKKTSLIKEMKI